MTLDYMDLECPVVMNRLTFKLMDIEKGTRVKVTANCNGFPAHIIEWCKIYEKELINCTVIKDQLYEAIVEW